METDPETKREEISALFSNTETDGAAPGFAGAQPHFTASSASAPFLCTIYSVPWSIITTVTIAMGRTASQALISGVQRAIEAAATSSDCVVPGNVMEVRCLRFRRSLTAGLLSYRPVYPMLPPSAQRYESCAFGVDLTQRYQY